MCILPDTLIGPTLQNANSSCLLKIFLEWSGKIRRLALFTELWIHPQLREIYNTSDVLE